MTPEELRRMIEDDEDYVASKRFSYSLQKVLERYPDACPDRVIASILMMTEEELAQRYEMIVKRIRRVMKPVSL